VSKFEFRCKCFETQGLLSTTSPKKMGISQYTRNLKAAKAMHNLHNSPESSQTWHSASQT
jgi:hypothetical protein